MRFMGFNGYLGVLIVDWLFKSFIYVIYLIEEFMLFNKNRLVG